MPKRARPHRARLYVDVVRNLYWDVPLSVGKVTVDVPVKLDALKRAKRGYPWSCWLAEAIMEYVRENPRAFGHPVLYVYVIASALFLIDKIKGQPAHAYKYKHNFGPLIAKFDTMSRKAFIKSLNGSDDLTLTIKPGRKRRIGESRVGGNGAGGGRTMTVSHGARRRAENAGLIPPRTGKQTTEELFV